MGNLSDYLVWRDGAKNVVGMTKTQPWLIARKEINLWDELITLVLQEQCTWNNNYLIDLKYKKYFKLIYGIVLPT